jgi:3'-5' exoribonuclease
MTHPGFPSPRDWAGEPGPAWPPPAGLTPGAPLLACYAVLESAGERASRNGAGRDVVLTEARGRVDAWLPASLEADWIRPGLYVGVRAIVEAAATPRIHIEEIVPLQVPLDELSLFLPHSTSDPAILEAELRTLIESIGDESLRRLVLALLSAQSEVGHAFRLAPAASRNHHAYLGGLFEHTVSVGRLCSVMAAHYERRVDRDLLVTGALLHDIGKVREIGAQVAFPYTTEGKLLGHIVLGLQMVAAEARRTGVDHERLLLLQHLVASHQGRYEWQSPREPRVLEALILHYVDDLDAKARHAIDLLDSVESGWTAWDRTLGRELFRHYDPPALEPEAKPPGKPARKRSRTGRTASRKRAADRRKGKKSRARPKARLKQPADVDPGPTAGRRQPAAQPGFVDRDTIDMFD